MGYGVADRIPGAAYNWSPHLSALEVAADLGTIGLLGYALLLTTLVRWLVNAPMPAIAPGLDCVNGAISPRLNPAIILSRGFLRWHGYQSLPHWHLRKWRLIVTGSDRLDATRLDAIDPRTNPILREFSTVVFVALVAAYY